MLLNAKEHIEKKMDIKIYVATHKIYNIPSDDVYIPIQIGKAINKPLPFVGDDFSNNISAKQEYYAELTAVYWAWKNIKADYIGLNHYRRYFCKKKNWFRKVEKKDIFQRNDFEKYLEQYPVILPKKRNYFIISRYNQYKKSHNINDLKLCKYVISKKCPEYLNMFDQCMNKTNGHIYNIFVMRYDIFCKYCEWLFEILFELEKYIDHKKYMGYQKRVYGYLAERLLDVWIEKNKINYKEVEIVNIEGNNWLKKIYQFIYKIVFK